MFASCGGHRYGQSVVHSCHSYGHSCHCYGHVNYPGVVDYCGKCHECCGHSYVVAVVNITVIVLVPCGCHTMVIALLRCGCHCQLLLSSHCFVVIAITMVIALVRLLLLVVVALVRLLLLLLVVVVVVVFKLLVLILILFAKHREAASKNGLNDPTQ